MTHTDSSFPPPATFFTRRAGQKLGDFPISSCGVDLLELGPGILTRDWQGTRRRMGLVGDISTQKTVTWVSKACVGEQLCVGEHLANHVPYVQVPTGQDRLRVPIFADVVSKSLDLQAYIPI